MYQAAFAVTVWKSQFSSLEELHIAVWLVPCFLLILAVFAELFFTTLCSGREMKKGVPG